jgi:general secretion pathway protein G
VNNPQNSSGSGRPNTVVRRLVILIVLVPLLVVLILKFLFVSPSELQTEAVTGQMGAFKVALDMFKVDNGFYPTGTKGLKDLVVQPAGATNWQQYMEKIPLDFWGHPYIYECPGKHRTNSYDLSSAGPDGKAGTEDDIVNWK